MYNRASADPKGNPWSEKKKLVWWDASAAKWICPSGDGIDFAPTKAPGSAGKDAGIGFDWLWRQ